MSVKPAPKSLFFDFFAPLWPTTTKFLRCSLLRGNGRHFVNPFFFFFFFFRAFP